jgi:hypothetical protein
MKDNDGGVYVHLGMDDGVSGTGINAGISTLVQSLQDQIAYLSTRIQNQPSFVFAPCLSKMAPSGWSWRGLKNKTRPCRFQSQKFPPLCFSALLHEGDPEIGFAVMSTR